MSRSDEAIREICLELIKRHTVHPIEFRLTRLYEKETCGGLPQEVQAAVAFRENELPVVLTYIDPEAWTLITTRRIVTCKDCIFNTTTADQILDWHWGDYKGHRQKPYTLGYLHTHQGTKNDIFIETRFASTLSIYAIISLTEQYFSERDEQERDRSPSNDWWY